MDDVLFFAEIAMKIATPPLAVLAGLIVADLFIGGKK